MEGLFFELLQICVGRRTCFSRVPQPDEWAYLYGEVKKQTLAGVAYEAILGLPKEQYPPRQIVLNLHGASERIATINKRVCRDTVWVSRFWEKRGYKGVILKGQANALLYPNPALRMSGDVDIWLDGDLHEIAAFVKRHIPKVEVTRIEMDFPTQRETDFELHFTPNFLYNPFANRRMQRYFREQMQLTQKVQLPDGEIEVPGTEMNLVFQISHIYRHLFYEGIGLRQLMDYYYLLQQPEVSALLPEVRKRLKQFGLYGFAGALMWVLAEVFALPQEQMVVAPDERRGRFLLSEIMRAGNFGQADDRTGDWSRMSRWERLRWGTAWSWRLIGQYPIEVLWHPYYRIDQYFWRLCHGYL